jgi:hypothetical protein
MTGSMAAFDGVASIHGSVAQCDVPHSSRKNKDVARMGRPAQFFEERRMYV